MTTATGSPSAPQAHSATIDNVTDCLECGYPIVWSVDASASICSVYGTHGRTHARMHPLVRDLARPVVRRHLKAVC